MGLVIAVGIKVVVTVSGDFFTSIVRPRVSRPFAKPQSVSHELPSISKPHPSADRRSAIMSHYPPPGGQAPYGQSRKSSTEEL